ncbi:MAG: RNA polymerase sigma factor [Steroidobacteraceae bacterium]|nr:RNA polymerase sigma factor [Steroidobacteraceae bacterium]MDW8260518.1 RNA polymerase sigma factor [Gammaproteobacteria bacterium]
MNVGERRAAALESFLAGVERKAFKIAQLALRNPDDALDAVQDAMLSLVKSYAHRSETEWKPLFYRILDNKVLDIQRRRSIRGRLTALLPSSRDDPDGDPPDPLAQAPDPAPLPAAQLETDEAIAALERALARLPHRQRQAFMLRSLEGLDVAATAQAMGCSEGSVKTHYFRALQFLRAQLGEFGS